MTIILVILIAIGLTIACIKRSISVKIYYTFLFLLAFLLCMAYFDNIVGYVQGWFSTAVNSAVDEILNTP